MPEWKVEQLRLTSFLSGSDRPKRLEEMITSAAGAEPTVEKSPVSFRGLCDVSEAISLQLQWVPGRIDWMLSTATTEVGDSIGGDDDIKALVEKYFLTWFASEDCPESVRIALGTILFKPIKDVDEGNKFLAPLLKPLSLPPNTKDLLYRVNRPVKSETTPGIVNRLATWSISHRQSLIIHLPAKMPIRVVEPVPKGDPLLVCRLEMDFNSEPIDSFKMNPVQQATVTGELLNYSLRCINQGDTGE